MERHLSRRRLLQAALGGAAGLLGLSLLSACAAPAAPTATPAPAAKPTEVPTSTTAAAGTPAVQATASSTPALKRVAPAKPVTLNIWLQTDYVPTTNAGVKARWAGIIKTGRLTAYAAEPLPACTDVTTSFLIGDMLQEVLVRKTAPDQALAKFIEAAKAIYAKYK